MLVVGAGGTPMLNGGAYWVTGPLLLVALVLVPVVRTGGRRRCEEPSCAA